MRLRAGKWLIGAALLATLAFPLLVGGTSALDGLTRLPILDYLGMATVIIASWCARTLKLQALLRHLGTDVGALRMLRVSLAADVGFLITPGGVGGYATSVYYLRRVRASLSDAVAVTSADQALDAIYFAVAIPLAAMRVTAAAAPHPTSLLVAFACALALLAIAAWAWRRFRQPGMRRPATVPTLPPWMQRPLAFGRGLIADLRKLAADPALFLRVLMLTSVQQLCRYGALWLIFMQLGHPLPFARVLLAQTLVVQAATLTGIPAGGGVAELGLTAAFENLLPPTVIAPALLLWRGATLYLGLIAGLGAMAWFALDARSAPTPDPGAQRHTPAS